MTYLTERQRDVLDFVKRSQADRGVAPTLKEIAAHFGFSSTASAQKHVGLLVEKGLLRKAKHQKRGLEVNVDEGPRVPLLGTVAAGAPIESFPGDETIAVPRSSCAAVTTTRSGFVATRWLRTESRTETWCWCSAVSRPLTARWWWRWWTPR